MSHIVVRRPVSIRPLRPFLASLCLIARMKAGAAAAEAAQAMQEAIVPDADTAADAAENAAADAAADEA